MKYLTPVKFALGALTLTLFSGAATAEVFGAGSPPSALTLGAPPVLTAGPARVWVPGHRKSVQRKRWIPGKAVQVWVPPVFEERCDPFGVIYQVQVAPGHYEVQAQPGHFEWFTETVFVPGFWKFAPKPVFTGPFCGTPAKGLAKHKGSSFGGYGQAGKSKKHKGYGG